MSKVTICDYQECESRNLVAVVIDSYTDFGRVEFCSPEHAVLWLFQQYPDMPLRCGPKTVMGPSPETKLTNLEGDGKDKTIIYAGEQPVYTGGVAT